MSEYRRRLARDLVRDLAELRRRYPDARLLGAHCHAGAACVVLAAAQPITPPRGVQLTVLAPTTADRRRWSIQ